MRFFPYITLTVQPWQPFRVFDFASYLRSNIDRESDIEGAARLGGRIYWITSHGRSKKGKRRSNRYRLFATDIADAPPRTSIEVGRPL